MTLEEWIVRSEDLRGATPAAAFPGEWLIPVPLSVLEDLARRLADHEARLARVERPPTPKACPQCYSLDRESKIVAISVQGQRIDGGPVSYTTHYRCSRGHEWQEPGVPDA